MNSKELKAQLHTELRTIQEKIENGKIKEVFEIAGDMEMLLESISDIYDDFFVTYAEAYRKIIESIEIMKNEYETPAYWIDSGYNIYESIIQNLKKYKGRAVNPIEQYLRKELSYKKRVSFTEKQLSYLTRAICSWVTVNAIAENNELFKYEMTENYYDCGAIDTVNIGECEIPNDYKTKKQDKLDGIPIKILQIIADKTNTSYNERVNSFYCFGTLHLNVNFSDKAKKRIDIFIEKILKKEVK